jgi:hypothetical protein
MHWCTTEMAGASTDPAKYDPDHKRCIPHSLLHPLQMGCGEYLVPVLGDENK